MSISQNFLQFFQELHKGLSSVDPNSHFGVEFSMIRQSVDRRRVVLFGVSLDRSRMIFGDPRVRFDLSGVE